MHSHIKSKPALLGLIVILSASTAFKCGGGGGALVEPTRKLRRASDDLAEATRVMIVLKRQLATEGKITPAEELVLTNLLFELNSSEKAFFIQVKELKAAPSPTAKDKLSVLLNHVIADLKNLQREGIAPIKNQEAIKNLSKLANSLTAATEMMSQFLNP